jgi:hypothetical protein
VKPVPVGHNRPLALELAPDLLGTNELRFQQFVHLPERQGAWASHKMSKI